MKSLSKAAIEMLMDAHERELLDQEPISGTAITRHIKGLVTAGLLKPELHFCKTKGKNYMAFFITPSGKNYLENLK